MGGNGVWSIRLRVEASRTRRKISEVWVSDVWDEFVGFMLQEEAETFIAQAVTAARFGCEAACRRLLPCAGGEVLAAAALRPR